MVLLVNLNIRIGLAALNIVIAIFVTQNINVIKILYKMYW